MRRLQIILLVVALLGSGSAWARLGGAGTQFLAIGAGARSVAMGSAVSALTGDLESIYWNPAGIASIEGTALGFTHTELYADMSLEDVAMAMPAMDGVFGISGRAFLSGSMEETTEEMPDGTGETFNANAFAFTLTYARAMTDKFSAGASFRFVHETLAAVSARNWAFDLGGTYIVGFRNLRLGFAIVNFGPDMMLQGDALEGTWGDPEWGETQTGDVPVMLQAEAYPMPMTFRAGVAYDLFSGEAGILTALVDGFHPVDQAEAMGIGFQYSYGDRYYLRAGHNTINNMEWAAGGGVLVPTGDSEMSIDYCYQNHEFLDGVHRIAIGFLPG